MQKYEYKVGKGIGFAGGFMHGTDVGHTGTDDTWGAMTPISLTSGKPAVQMN
jgi:hypothetical protein